MTTPVAVLKSDDIWYRNLSILMSPSNRLIEFFPNKHNTLQENLNSLVRLGAYGSVIIAMYKRDPKHLVWILVAMLLTYVINETYKTKEELEIQKFQNLKTRERTPRPTINNPFMNPTFLDIGKEPVEQYHQDTKQAENTREEIKEKFSYNLYSDIEDVFKGNSSQRQFYTVPSTTIPNDQETFTNFLYGGMKSCKEDSSACQPYLDLRRNPAPQANPI
jgi:hypothetical protein